jgi:Tfp pilus assembly protein PilN
MRAVNLLPRDEAPRSFEAKRGVAFGAAGGTALVTVVLAAAMISAAGAISSEQDRLDTLNMELAALPQPANTAADEQSNAALVAEKAARIAALSTALGGRVAWDRVLRQVSQVLPEDVWLTSLTTTGAAPTGAAAPAAAPAAGPGVVPGVELIGSTYSHDGVARLLSRLAVIPSLTNVRLQASTALPSADQASGTRRIVQFTILADVRTAESAS